MHILYQHETIFCQLDIIIKLYDNIAVCIIISESPVPLEFTPVLGILIGVVATLAAVAAAIVLIIRCKYSTSTDAKKGRRHNKNNNNRRVQLAVAEEEMEEEEDAIMEGEEDMCLKAAMPSKTIIRDCLNLIWG